MMSFTSGTARLITTHLGRLTGAVGAIRRDTAMTGEFLLERPPNLLKFHTPPLDIPVPKGYSR